MGKVAEGCREINESLSQILAQMQLGGDCAAEPSRYEGGSGPSFRPYLLGTADRTAATATMIKARRQDGTSPWAYEVYVRLGSGGTVLHTCVMLISTQAQVGPLAS